MTQKQRTQRTGAWHAMILDEARREAEALVQQAQRTAAEFREHGNSQTYQDGLLTLTARVGAIPTEIAGLVIADLCGIIAWGDTRG